MKSISLLSRGTMSARGALPNVIIIGAQKCGTSSLHYYLGLHPQIFMSAEKELNFFIEQLNWHRGLEWYRAQFSATAEVRGEASPNYTTYPHRKGVVERMHRIVPDAKLIYLVRDPVERIISHYRHNLAQHQQKKPLEVLMQDPDNKYFANSRYALQLEQYLRYYPLSQILIVQQETLRALRRETLQRVFHFLGVDPDFFDPRMNWERHRTDRKMQKSPLGRRIEQIPPLRWLRRRIPSHMRWPLDRIIYGPFSRPPERPAVSAALRRFAAEQLAEDVQRLRALTGEAFAEWSV